MGFLLLSLILQYWIHTVEGKRGGGVGSVFMRKHEQQYMSCLCQKLLFIEFYRFDLDI